MRFGKTIAAATTLTLCQLYFINAVAHPLTTMADFGANPGTLSAFKYVPEGLPANSPLVVALHGCTQTASNYDDETGWVKYADMGKFALLLPQQERTNNPSLCFNWFESDDIQRDQGEALSIKHMIDKMVSDHDIDPKRIYITGLSAGGGMTAVMLATYPELFDGGAIIAGLPYKCASGSIAAFNCMNPGKNMSPTQWGEGIRNASLNTGPWPRVSIWQGTTDMTVKPMNAQELIDQWTNVHGIDQTPDVQDTIDGQSHQVFKDTAGNILVESYTVAGMGHATPINPGTGESQCGTAAPYILDTDICSSFHIAKFWGILPSAPSHVKSMKITFKIDGGFAPLPIYTNPTTIDTTAIDPKLANQIATIISDIHFFNQPKFIGTIPKGAADYRTYVITVAENSRSHTVRLTDPVADPSFEELISLLQMIVRSSKK